MLTGRLRRRQKVTKFGLQPCVPGDDPLTCETCGATILFDVWYGTVEEHDAEGIFVGHSYHCTSCLNVLARMADALDSLEGPNGPLSLNEQGDVEL